MTIDIQLFYLLNSLAGQSRLLDSVIIFLANDLAYVVIAALIALVFFLNYAKREKWKLLIVAGVSSLVARYGATELIRFFYHHPRPFAALPNVHQLFNETSWSFPSGHATFFFALATAVYLYRKQWGSWFLGAATIIAVSRVIAGVHYPSDILGGVVIGIAVAYATYYLARTWSPKSADYNS